MGAGFYLSQVENLAILPLYHMPSCYCHMEALSYQIVVVVLTPIHPSPASWIHLTIIVISRGPTSEIWQVTTWKRPSKSAPKIWNCLRGGTSAPFCCCLLPAGGDFLFHLALKPWSCTESQCLPCSLSDPCFLTKVCLFCNCFKLFLVWEEGGFLIVL